MIREQTNAQKQFVLDLYKCYYNNEILEIFEYELIGINVLFKSNFKYHFPYESSQSECQLEIKRTLSTLQDFIKMFGRYFRRVELHLNIDISKKSKLKYHLLKYVGMRKVRVFHTKRFRFDYYPSLQDFEKFSDEED